MIGSGAMGPLAAQAIRHAAAQNGVWALGNFGGPPPTTSVPQPPAVVAPQPTDVRQVSKISPEEYKPIFNSSSVAMAVASMGGSVVDANDLFCRLTNYTREELRSMTIFNLTARSDLYQAFDRISAMIEGAAAPSDRILNDPIILKGTTKNGSIDLGLSISLIRDSKDGVLKCFCVTLLKGVPTPGSTWPVLATISDCLVAKPQRQPQVLPPVYHPPQSYAHEIPMPPSEMYGDMIKIQPNVGAPTPTYTTG